MNLLHQIAAIVAFALVAGVVMTSIAPKRAFAQPQNNPPFLTEIGDRQITMLISFRLLRPIFHAEALVAPNFVNCRSAPMNPLCCPSLVAPPPPVRPSMWRKLPLSATLIQRWITIRCRIHSRLWPPSRSSSMCAHSTTAMATANRMQMSHLCPTPKSR